MLCKKCGSQINDGLKVCPFCGTSIENDNVVSGVGSAPVQNNSALDIFSSSPASSSTSESATPVNPAPSVSEPVVPVNPSPSVSEPVAPVNPAPSVNGPVAPVNPMPDLVDNVVEEGSGINPESVQNNVNSTPAPKPVVPIITEPIKNETTDSHTERKKSGGGKVVVVILLLLILCGAGVAAYFYLFNNEKMVVSTFVNNVYKKLDKAIVDSPVLDYGKDTVKLDGDLSINTNISGFETLNSEKFSYSYGLDFANKKAYVGGSIAEDDVKIIDAVIYALNDSNYILFKGDTNRLLKIDGNGFSIDVKELEKVNVSKDDMRYILKAYKNIIIESIDKEDLVKSEKNISLSGKDIKVNALTYTLDKSTYKKFVISFIDNTLKDEKLLDILSKMTDSEVADIKKDLEDSKNSSSLDQFDSKVVFDIYTKGVTNTFVGFDVNFEDSTNIQVRDNGNDTNVTINYSGNSFNFVIKSSSDYSYDIDYEFKSGDQVINGNVTTTYNKVSDKKYEFGIVLKVNYDNQSFTLNTNYVQSIGEEISGIDVSTAIDADSLTEEETQEIFAKFKNSKLYNMVGSLMQDLMGNIEQKSDFYDDYYYDFGENESMIQTY